ncbi:MAG TPA: purine-nucleoside phosphorylase [Planctomycetaceae bacterium]|nr:purine-nucleoside phosphorylase [Planctomycetaceae bacterium]
MGDDSNATTSQVNWTLLSPTQLANKVDAARCAIQAIKFHQPTVAIVLGSGLGGLADAIDHAHFIPYDQIPDMPQTHAAGHAGRLVLGHLGGMPVVVMQGRAHRYEGWPNQAVEFPIRCMHALGARRLIVTNAAGGLNPRFRAGDLMVIDSHIDLLWDRRVRHRQTPRPRSGNVYDRATIENAKQIARLSNTVLHQGTYLATLGPTYETRNEYRMFREIGGDAVGMSTLPEVKAARELEMDVTAFSVITNVASTDEPQSTTHDEVVECGKEAGPKLQKIICELLSMWSGEPD